MSLPVRVALRNLRQYLPIEAVPLIVAVGCMSTFGLILAYSKATRAPDVFWTKQKITPWNVTLERMEQEKLAKGH